MPRVDRIARFRVPHRMSVVSSEIATAILELRSAALTLIAVVLKTTDLEALSAELDQRATVMPGVFEDEPVAIDLSQVRQVKEPVRFVELIALLRRHRMVPVAATTSRWPRPLPPAWSKRPKVCACRARMARARCRRSIAGTAADDHRAPAALGLAGIRTRLLPDRAGAGESQRRSHRRRAHPCLRTTARTRHRRRQGQHRSANLQHRHGSPAAMYCRRLSHYRRALAHRSSGHEFPVPRQPRRPPFTQMTALR